MHVLNTNHACAHGNFDALYARYLDEIIRHGDTFTGRNGETKALFGCSITNPSVEFIVKLYLPLEIRYFMMCVLAF